MPRPTGRPFLPSRRQKSKWLRTVSLRKPSKVVFLALLVPFTLALLSAEAQVPSSGWTPIAGATTGFDVAGNYGTLGVASKTNYPGARFNAMNWTDKNGNFWLFGGEVSGSDGGAYFANDLWMFTSPSSGSAQSGTWTWVGGSSVLSCLPYAIGCLQGQGTYGTQGIASAANIPSVRYGGSTWVDADGDFWLFGGEGIDDSGHNGMLNDMWKYDPVAGQWTWIGGPSTAQENGLGYGNAGVYGTQGVAAAANIPGARYNATSWTDAKGNLWLFGGTGLDGGDFVATLNDLWEFTPSTGMWRWVSGSSEVGPVLKTTPAILGTKGVEAPSNTPGSIAGGAGFTDTAGNLWLFGGANMWRFDITTSQWAWITGAGQPYCPLDPFLDLNACIPSPPVAKALGVADPANDPAGDPSTSAEGTVPAASWVDPAGNFWMFGNTGPDITGENNGFYFGLTTPLWMFNPSTTQWTWMGGDLATSNCYFYLLVPYPAVNCDGTYGPGALKFVVTPGNSPGARDNANGWADKSGNFWLFGGAALSLGIRNDLWEYRPYQGSLPPAATPIFSLKPGLYLSGGPLSIANGMTGASIYYTTDGSTPTTSSTLYTGPLNLSSPIILEAIAVAPGYSNSAVARSDYSFNQFPDGVGFSPAPAAYPSPVAVTLMDGTDSTSIYYTLDGTTPTPNPSTNSVNGLFYNAPITVNATETINAIACTNYHDVLDGIATKGDQVCSPVSTGPYAIAGGAAAAPTFNPVSENSSTPITVVLSDVVPGATIYYTLDGSTPTTSSSVYTAPITPPMNAVTTINAIAVASGYTQSAVASSTYGIGRVPTAPPVFSIPAGTYTSAQTITITDATPGAGIFYTIDGSTPTLASPVYTGPITINATSTLQAIATAPIPYWGSTVTSASYVINNLPAAAAPTFSPLAGTYTSAQTVSILDITGGSTIYYTTDGTTPTIASTKYSSAITVSGTETLNAIAVASGYSSSAVASAAYTIDVPPTFTLQASPGSLTVTAGNQGSVSLTVTPANGFNSMVSFACSGLPAGSTCSFSPATVVPSGASATTVMTISTSSQSAALRRSSRSYLSVLALPLAVLLFTGKRRRVQHILLLALAFVALGWISGCGGSVKNAGGGPVTSTVTVTATAPSVQQTTSVSLTLN